MTVVGTEHETSLYLQERLGPLGHAALLFRSGHYGYVHGISTISKLSENLEKLLGNTLQMYLYYT